MHVLYIKFLHNLANKSVFWMRFLYMYMYCIYMVYIYYRQDFYMFWLICIIDEFRQDVLANICYR